MLPTLEDFGIDEKAALVELLKETMTKLIAAEKTIERLRAALNEVIRIKDDTLGPRNGIETILGREHFDRGCRMAFYRCAKIATDALT